MHPWGRTITLLLALLARRADAQYWTAYAGTGYGSDNCVVPSNSEPLGAELAGPMWNLGAGRAFGDSAMHFRFSLELEHQAWNERLSGYDYPKEFRGEIDRKLELFHVLPQVVFPIHRSVALVVAMDLGIVVRAHTSRVAEARVVSSSPWGTTNYGPWSPYNDTYDGVDDLNPFPWSFRFGAEVGGRWLASFSLAVGNSTYRPPSGFPDGLTPVFARIGLGHRF